MSTQFLFTSLSEHQDRENEHGTVQEDASTARLLPSAGYTHTLAGANTERLQQPHLCCFVHQSTPTGFTKHQIKLFI